MENIDFKIDFLYQYLIKLGWSEKLAHYSNAFALMIALLIIIVIVQIITRRILITTFHGIAIRTKIEFDDLLVKNKAPRNIAHIIPLIIAIKAIPIIFKGFPIAENIMLTGLKVFTIVLVLWLVRSILSTIKDYFKTLPSFRDKPIDSYVQVFMIFAWLIGLFFAFAVITGIAFIKFVTTLGAASAVILLIFKDTILGFVASIQVSINDMVRIGDWITFEKYGADGDVIEINLATVKVQNFDKTITTIPTYALISDSFKNWRGMSDSGGRRIKRAILVKQNSVIFLSDKSIEELKSIQLIKDYLHTRQKEVAKHNEEKGIDKSLLLNGRNLTNLGLYRKYIETYVSQHSAVNKNMMIMARQLQPTAEGIPIEVYAFSSDKRWQNYEYIQADIFDHVIAAASYFDLELFEHINNSSSNLQTPT